MTYKGKIDMKIKHYFLLPGYVMISDDYIEITTVLGSCVALCLWDRRLRYGGINHYLYSYMRKEQNSAIAGEVANRYLINQMLQMGSRPSDIDAYIAGGSSYMSSAKIIGKQNVECARRYLKHYGISIGNEYVGGRKGRRIKFNLKSGEIKVDRLQNVIGGV